MNRITEVVECEHNNAAAHDISATTQVINSQHDNDEDANDEEDDVKISTMNQLNLATKCADSPTIHNVTNELKASKNQNNNKAKGFSARFLQNLNFKRNHDAPGSGKNQHKSNRNSMPDVPLLKLSAGKVKAANNMPADGSDRSKKIKILGRYFQVKKRDFYVRFEPTTFNTDFYVKKRLTFEGFEPTILGTNLINNLTK